MDLREKLRQDILNILINLKVKDLEALKECFEPTEIIDEALRLKRDIFKTE